MLVKRAITLLIDDSNHPNFKIYHMYANYFDLSLMSELCYMFLTSK